MIKMLTFFLLLLAVSSVTLTPLHDQITPRSKETCGYESCTPPQADKLNVHIVPHTHDDVGWLKTVDQYYYGSRNDIQKAGVQYILDSVIKELWEDPKRRFIYVETAFFWKWWVLQSDAVRHKVHALVRQGRLQFVGGAWSMNDEAASHYQSTIDQFTWGLRKLNQTFGQCGLPHVGWQIDPFGHAREFASLLAAMGYDGLFLGRIDYQDKRARLRDRNMEMVWRGDDDLGKSSDIFTGVLYNTYSPPAGFCFDVLCNDEPIIDDVHSPIYNVDKRVTEFLVHVNQMSEAYRTNNVLVTMGDDFQYQEAGMWFRNLDKLIQYTNMKAAQDGLNVTLFYSTPNCYLKAVKDSNPTLPTKQDDFFPYASDPTAYWTGYFTSRPTTKYFEREGNSYLQTVKQLQVLAGLEDHNRFVLNELKSAMGVMQHHDAVTGTEKQHVTHDYERLLNEAIDDALIIAKQAFNKISLGNVLQPSLLSYNRCHLNESRCETSEDSEQFVVTVYNPLAWSLHHTAVRIPVADGNYIVYAPDGTQLEIQIVPLPESVIKIPTRDSKATHEIVFYAINLPGLGFQSFYIKKQVNNIVKRDIHARTDDIATKLKEKRIKDYYGNINDYWKNVKEQPYIDIKNIEEQFIHKTSKLNTDADELQRFLLIKENVPILPKINEHSDFTNKPIGINKYVNQVKDVDLQVLNDKKDNYNQNIEELKKIIREARRKMIDMADSGSKWRNNAGKEIKYPDLSEEELRMLSDDPMVVQRYPDDQYLGNGNIKLRINNTTGQVSHIILADGTETDFEITSFYYPGCVGDNREPANRSSGAYIFRPNATKPLEIVLNNTNTIRGTLVDELWSNSEYMSSVLRVYHSIPEYIEVECTVGPIPIDDNVGKEIVIRYRTDIINNGIFYTDSNGRQVLKRRLNQRPQWNVTLEEPVAGNYYPVTNKIFIEDDKNRFAVLTDRSQGGSSLLEGNVELMLHRRLLHDDAFGVGEALNETAKGLGLIVTLKHRIYVSRANNNIDTMKERKGVLQFHLSPQVFVSDAEHLELDHWLKLKNQYSAIKQPLPDGVHLLTLEPWDKSSLLLRLENYLEKSDENPKVQVDLSTIFNSIKIKTVKETTLSANQWLNDYKKWEWSKENDFSKSFNKQYGSFNDNDQAKDENELKNDDKGFKISLDAKQIRTFVIDYEIDDE